ncbi:hypothetical protein AVEN_76335-1 [Araneus ventricosus]|uniref:Uncharacterized protein n=1 Tax=Araneus ventricosus TaxID=182803 RepID=A0A4Y2NT78_ARAVE|nr:hypothetical protein AVEN_76335-1 [Araneus ventricosus]
MSSREHRAAESQAGLLDLEYLYGLKKVCKKDVIDLCMEMNLFAKEYVCPTCGVKMVLIQRDGSDGYSWICRKFGVNSHHVKRTVRKGSWFDEIVINGLVIVFVVVDDPQRLSRAGASVHEPVHPSENPATEDETR